LAASATLGRLAKNSTRSVVFALEFSVPTSVVPAAFALADVRTGKFCRSLAPVSASPASLAVMPLLPRSMPWPVLPRIWLPRIDTDVLAAT
jgi:hypothetical protein